MTGQGAQKTAGTAGTAEPVPDGRQAVIQTTTMDSAVKTETSVKAEPTSLTLGISVNPWYFLSLPGVLKILQLILGIVCMACGSPAYYSYADFFLLVTAVTFIITMILSLIYLFSVKELLPNIPWLQAEGISHACITLFYFIAMVVMLAKTTERKYHYALNIVNAYGSYIAAGVFALFNTAAYAGSTYYLYRDYVATTLPPQPPPPTAQTA